MSSGVKSTSLCTLLRLSNTSMLANTRHSLQAATTDVQPQGPFHYQSKSDTNLERRDYKLERGPPKIYFRTT
eukprot:1996199-Amphidinium_carterae.1